MLKYKYILIFTAIFLTTNACSQKTTVEKIPQTFTPPQIPTLLTSPEQRAEYLVLHYWENYDFKDTSLISNANITEQAFVDFLSVLPYTTQTVTSKAIHTMMQQAEVNMSMYLHFMGLSEKYLYEPNSPFRNDECYIGVLENILANTKLEEMHKVRPKHQFERVLKNRMGEKATDFTYIDDKGSKSSLHAAEGNLFLLFFFNPECPNCKEIKEYIQQKGIDKQVRVLLVNPDINLHLDSLYDLRAIPTLYLLNKDKTILLKDKTIEEIENYLQNRSRE